jgi:hypothetical protein
MRVSCGLVLEIAPSLLQPYCTFFLFTEVPGATRLKSLTSEPIALPSDDSTPRR